MIVIRPAQLDEAPALQSGFDTHMGWTKPNGYFETVCQRQDAGSLVLLVAMVDRIYVGHCKIVWFPDYPHFREQHIPEIQDLNVCPDYRRQGIATRLLDEAEERIRERASAVGIGFGLYRDYGVAQRLYIKRGYIPDGHGVYYHYQPVIAGNPYPVDDDLVLYLTKQLG